MNKPQVIAISGASGCGKTSLIKQLSAEFNCPSLFFDDHVDKDTYPEDMKAWLHRGANVSEIKTPKLTAALELLKVSANSPFIFIEEPFGKQRKVMSTLVDQVILLDIPLEICLARLIKRNIGLSAENSLTLIPNFLIKYEDYFRDIYFEAVQQVSNNCDLIINDINAVDVMSKSIIHWLQSYYLYHPSVTEE